MDKRELEIDKSVVTLTIDGKDYEFDCVGRVDLKNELSGKVTPYYISVRQNDDDEDQLDYVVTDKYGKASPTDLQDAVVDVFVADVRRHQSEEFDAHESGLAKLRRKLKYKKAVQTRKPRC